MQAQQKAFTLGPATLPRSLPPITCLKRNYYTLASMTTFLKNKHALKMLGALHKLYFHFPVKEVGVMGKKTCLYLNYAGKQSEDYSEPRENVREKKNPYS